MTTDARAEIAAALGELVTEGLITPEQAEVIGERTGPARTAGPAERAPSPVLELAGYVGGALVVAGGGMALSSSWRGLSGAGQVVVMGVLTGLLAAVAVLAGRPWRPATETGPVRRRLASTLAALSTAGAAVTATRITQSHPDHMLAATVTMLAAVVGYLVVRGTVALIACWLATLWLLQVVLDSLDAAAVWLVLGYALLGAGWLALGLLRRVAQPRAAALAGSVTGLFAAQAGALSLDGNLPWYGLTVGVLFIAAGFAGYRTSRQPALLAPAVLTALVVPASAISNLVDNVPTAGAVVAVIGAALLTAAATGLLRRPPGGTPTSA